MVPRISRTGLDSAAPPPGTNHGAPGGWATVLATGLLLAGLGAAQAAQVLPPARAHGADLFTNGGVQHLRLELSAESLDSLRNAPRQDVPARVLHGGTVYSNVALHLKGRTGSFRPVHDKPGLTLDFDQFDGTQTLQGLTKVHLDNSVEDPAYLNQILGTYLFRQAGIPAPRVAHARVSLNGRELGPYLLREGFTSEFLSIHFQERGGTLYEPVPSPTGTQWRRVTGAPADTKLEELGEAAREPDLNRRWQRFQRLLDIDRFISLMALEVMLGHRDGYCLAANNYRIYVGPGTNPCVFLPHGMDQLFGRSDLPVRPHMTGPVAHALIEVPEGRQRYRDRAGELFTNLLTAEHLAGLIRQHAIPDLRSSDLSRSEARAVQQSVALLQSRVTNRLAFLAAHLDDPEPAPLRFVEGRAQLGGWRPVDPPAGGKLDQQPGPANRASLHIRAGPVTSASWRTTQWLEPGRYQFQGQVCTAGVRTLEQSRNKGAGLRVTGVPSPAPHQLTGDSGWTGLSVEFIVPPPGGERELVCELRASAGEAWFDVGSLQLVRPR